MCYHVNVNTNGKQISDQFDLSIPLGFHFPPIHHQSGFDFPQLPITTHQGVLQLASWGLVPEWVKSPDQAMSMKSATLNARAESIFQKPAFAESMVNRRCLVFLTGFFEWQAVGKNKYPFFIHCPERPIIPMAGIFSHDPLKISTNEKDMTFSIVTVQANALMSKIHNTKQRMPLILKDDQLSAWMAPESSQKTLKSLMLPYDGPMKAHSVKLRLQQGRFVNEATATDRVDYPALAFKQGRLF